MSPEPPDEVAWAADETPASLAARVLPPGYELVYPATRLTFGAARDGVLLAFRESGTRGDFYVWYFFRTTERPTLTGAVVRTPQRSLADNDVVFTLDLVLPANADAEPDRELILLSSERMPTTFGGELVPHADVFKQEGASIDRLGHQSVSLAGAADVAQLRTLAKPFVSGYAPRGFTRKTVVDVFFALPPPYVDLPAERRRKLLSPRTRSVVIADIANNYLYLYPDGDEASYEIILFKEAGGSTLVGVTRRNAADDFRTRFVRYEKDGWRDVTGDVTPNFDLSLSYALHRNEATLGVYDPEGVLIEVLAFRGGRFTTLRKLGPSQKLDARDPRVAAIGGYWAKDGRCEDDDAFFLEGSTLSTPRGTGLLATDPSWVAPSALDFQVLHDGIDGLGDSWRYDKAGERLLHYGFGSERPVAAYGRCDAARLLPATRAAIDARRPRH